MRTKWRTSRSRSETLKRREEIVRWLTTENVLTYEQIQKRFRVAPMTSRRDVSALDGDGRVVKILRGAMQVASTGLLTEGPLYLRLKKNLAAKRIIAQAALRLITPGKTLYLDAGTTCIEFARLIAASRLAVTVVTNSVLVSASFCQSSNVKIVQIGGTLSSFNGCTTGAETEAAAENYFIDAGFFSTLGYVPGEGTYESNAETFRVKLAFAKRCAEVVLLVDHTKFGQRALNRVLADSNISKIITDREVPLLNDARVQVGKEGAIGPANQDVLGVPPVRETQPVSS